MKSIRYWSVLAAVTFGCLFYKQTIGINYLLFSMLLQALLVWRDKSLLSAKIWWFGSAVALLTALAVVLINSKLSLVTFFVGHLFLPSFAFRRKESVFLTFIFSLYSLLAAIPLAIIRRADSVEEHTQRPEKTKGPMYLAIAISAALSFAFFLLYRSANPLFKHFTQEINLSWISFGWLLSCGIGYFFIKGLTTNEKITELTKKDTEALQPLQNTTAAVQGDRNMYTTAGLVLFIILNLFQFLVNALDVNNLYIEASLPEGITLSDFVHQAVFGILATIAIALLCISYLFHSWFNFDPKGKLILKYCLIWVVQAQVMLINTVVRNWWYIQSYQLTYLRILVFIVLLICSLALYFIWQKLQHKQSSWYFFNSFFKSLLVIVFVCSFIDWDRQITSYNLKHCSAYENLDIKYLLELSSANNTELQGLLTNKKITAQNKQAILKKIQATHLEDRFQQWPSWNLRAQRNESLYFNLYK